MTLPTDDDNDELLLSCRYGDLEDVQTYIKNYGADILSQLRDENGNSVLHMVCANGHTDVLNYLLPLVSPALLAAQNLSGSTALHWATLNSHLGIMKTLVDFPGGPGIDLIEIKNAAGHSPLADAELAGWDEGAKWLVQMMRLDSEETGAAGTGEEEGDGDALVDGKAGVDRDVEIEIEDAEGRVAKMSIKASMDKTP